MTDHGPTYAEHVAFYQRQQLFRKQQQFGMLSRTQVRTTSGDAPPPQPPARPAVVVERPADVDAPEPDVARPTAAEAQPDVAAAVPDPAAVQPGPVAAQPNTPAAQPDPAATQSSAAAVPPTPAVAPQVLPSIGGIGRAAAVNAPPLAQPPPDEPHTRTLTRAIAQPATMDRTIRLRISIDSGPNSGARFAFPEGEFVIGRAPDSDLPVTDDTVSHHHAKLVVTSRRATIEDLGSLNGTKFGGTVELRGVAILSPGDHVSFGSTSVTIGPGDQHG